MLSSFALLSTLSAVAFSVVNALPSPAHLDSNLVYRSPSLNVRALEMDTTAIHRKFKRNSDGKPYYTGNLTFDWGVASGDPHPDSAILWTKAQKLDLFGVSDAAAYPPICLHWVVSTSNSSFDVASSVQNGYVYTTQDVEFIAKVEAINLKPYTQYYYRFQGCTNPELGVSKVGAFKTLPSEDQQVEKLRLAVFSCSNLPYGFFNAYGNAANNSDRLDYVQHVGDYIYEYRNGQYGDGTATGRLPEPVDRECSSLQDYRDRYASYRKESDLQNLHQKLAWQTVWDDHEVGDNTWSMGSADSNNTIQGQIGDYQFSQRKANAVRAYYEWMPIRQVETDDKLRIWRSFKLGKLATMIMLDTRQYDRSITDLYYNTAEIEAASDNSDRSMTGSKQQSWLFDRLKENRDRNATWPLIMQQIVFQRVNYSIATGGATDFNVDAWSGYRAQRDKILDFIDSEKITNSVILSGDSHASWVGELVKENSTDYDAVSGSGGLGVEFAGSAVSSPSSYGYGPTWNDERYNGVAKNLTLATPSLQYAEGKYRGYFELEITPQAARATYYGFEDQETRNSNVTELGTFETLAGSNKLTRPLNGGVVPAAGALGAGASSQ